MIQQPGQVISLLSNLSELTWKVGAAAVADSAMKKSFVKRWQQMKTNWYRSCTFAHYCNVVGIATEWCNILLHPPIDVEVRVRLVCFLLLMSKIDVLVSKSRSQLSENPYHGDHKECFILSIFSNNLLSSESFIVGGNDSPNSHYH